MSLPAPYGVLPSDRFTNWRKRFWKAEQASNSANGDAGSPPASSFRREQRPFLPADLAHEEREALLVQMWQALTDAERSRYIGRDHAKPRSSISPMDALAKAADAVGGPAPPSPSSAARGYEARSDAAVDGLAALFGADEALRAAEEEPAPAPRPRQAPPQQQQQAAPPPQQALPPPQQLPQQQPQRRPPLPPLPPAAAAAALAAAALAAALAAAAVPQQQKPPPQQPARTLAPATFSSSGQLQFNSLASAPARAPARALVPIPHDYTTQWPVQRLQPYVLQAGPTLAPAQRLIPTPALMPAPTPAPMSEPQYKGIVGGMVMGAPTLSTWTPGPIVSPFSPVSPVSPVSPSISQWKPPTPALMSAVMPSPTPSPGPTVSPWAPPVPAPTPSQAPAQTLAPVSGLVG